MIYQNSSLRTRTCSRPQRIASRRQRPKELSELHQRRRPTTCDANPAAYEPGNLAPFPTSNMCVPHCVRSVWFCSNTWRPVEPILSLRRKEVDVNGIFGADKLVRGVWRNDQDCSSARLKLLALRKDFTPTLDNPCHLFIFVMVQRENAARFDSPLHER